MDTDIRIRAVGLPQRDLLIGMYDRFEPLGLAFGLPPYSAEARHYWIGFALAHKLNLAAFSPCGDVIGHCFLAADKPGCAELAMFVHQEFRSKGVGTALLRTALEQAELAGLRRVWTLTSSDNQAALHVHQKCGFRLMNCAFPAVEFAIDLPLADAIIRTDK